MDINWENVRRDGTTIWCRHLAKALPTTDGSQSTIWITEDISDRRAAAGGPGRRPTRSLELRVQQRTEELAQTNARLVQEVTERKEIESNLRASEARFRDLSEMSSDWFWEQDARLPLR